MHKILVIEDNEGVRENIAEILSLSGYEVETAIDGIDGIEKARNYEPDLILCDIMMPKLDGFGVLKIVSEDARLKDRPFIFLSAKTDNEDVRRGMGIGADDYITKPFDDLSLLEAIEVRLKKFQNANENRRDLLLSSTKLEQAFSTLLEDTEERKFSEKEYIYEHGKTPRWIYYVVSGLVKHKYMNDLGKEIILEVWKEGEIFGIEAPYMDNRYFGSAVAFRDSKIRCIKLDIFKEAVKSDPNMANYLIDVICNRKRNYAHSLGMIAYSSVRKKVANSLVFFSDLYGSNDIEVSREDLAARATTAKETLIRALSDFKSENLIKTSKGMIHILDKKALESMPT